jgi:hypothetical protein
MPVADVNDTAELYLPMKHKKNVMPTINKAKFENDILVVSSTSVSTWLVAKDEQTIFIGGFILVSL